MPVPGERTRGDVLVWLAVLGSGLGCGVGAGRADRDEFGWIQDRSGRVFLHKTSLESVGVKKRCLPVLPEGVAIFNDHVRAKKSPPVSNVTPFLFGHPELWFESKPHFKVGLRGQRSVMENIRVPHFGFGQPGQFGLGRLDTRFCRKAPKNGPCSRQGNDRFPYDLKYQNTFGDDVVRVEFPMTWLGTHYLVSKHPRSFNCAGSPNLEPDEYGGEAREDGRDSSWGPDPALNPSEDLASKAGRWRELLGCAFALLFVGCAYARSRVFIDFDSWALVRWVGFLGLAAPGSGAFPALSETAHGCRYDQQEHSSLHLLENLSPKTEKTGSSTSPDFKLGHYPFGIPQPARSSMRPRRLRHRARRSAGRSLPEPQRRCP